jgi:DNA ligase-1
MDSSLSLPCNKVLADVGYDERGDIFNNKNMNDQMMKCSRFLRGCAYAALLLLSVTAANPSLAQNDKPAPVMLANVYHRGVDLQQYWVSEKYDGVRGYWDGARLMTRGGEAIAAPSWFIAGWPKEPMDGELWIAHGKFSETVSTIRRQTPDDAAWRKVRFMVFDVPGQPGTFDQRLPILQATVARIGLPWVQTVRQCKVADHAALQVLLNKTVKQGGEGLMLHRGASLYRAERSDDLQKVKLHDDAEAKVVAYLPGKGKHLGRVGALLVEMPDGQRFKLGTGLTDAQRETPPAIGAQVTYRYRGLNDSGIPRFASFLRVREDVQAVPQ